MNCFKSPYLKVHYFADKSLLIAYWLNKPTGHQYQEAMRLLLELGQGKQIRNWLVNLIGIGQLNVENVHWMYENWFPQFLRMPTEKYACIAPNNVYNLLVLEDMFDYRKHQLSFDFQFFSDMRSALEWVKAEAAIDALFNA